MTQQAVKPETIALNDEQRLELLVQVVLDIVQEELGTTYAS